MNKPPQLKIGSMIRGKSKLHMNKVRKVTTRTTGKRFGVVWGDSDDKSQEFVTRRALSLIAHGQADKRLSESEPDSESSESTESESDNDVFNSENDDDDTSVEEEDDSAEQLKTRESDLLHVKGLQLDKGGQC